MDIQTMNSNDDYSMDGKSLQHNTGNNGSMRTVRVGSRSIPLYPLAIVCLGLLNAVLMLTAIVIGVYCGKVSGGSNPYQITAQALIIEVKQIQIMHTEAVKAQEEVRHTLETELGNHRQLKLQLEQVKALSDGLQVQIETLQMEKATLTADSSDIPQPSKSWQDSRADCIGRGADLAVIDSMEEQVNLFEYLPKRDPSVRPWWSGQVGVWIGLTDIQTEDNWVWVNNVTLQNETYWIGGEPNNHGASGSEDCAALMNRRNPKATWYDARCQDNKEWLCEMEPN
ncbi:C-type lectin domain family 4 member F-like isoform X2 [Cebidichthys violaceus]|uniref:C-type lectin domain family 4 member F-like isoform X2 n=1 Tax=Cebidichthys violaceus TaxID=271503 RepID=UPI0035CBCDAF